MIISIVALLIMDPVNELDVIVTIFSSTNIGDELLAGFNEALRPLDVQDANSILIKSVTELSSPRRCLEYALTIPGDIEALEPLRRDLKRLGNKFKADVNVQLDNYQRRYKRLAVFDMDSTLIEQEVVDEIARYAGLYDEISVSFSF